MSRQRGAVAEDDDLHASTSDGHIHASQVAQEAYLALFVRADERDDDDVAFLTLEAVDGVDGDQSAEGLEELVLAQQLSEQLHLCAIG